MHSLSLYMNVCVRVYPAGITRAARKLLFACNSTHMDLQTLYLYTQIICTIYRVVGSRESGKYCKCSTGLTCACYIDGDCQSVYVHSRIRYIYIRGQRDWIFHIPSDLIRNVVTNKL